MPAVAYKQQPLIVEVIDVPIGRGLNTKTTKKELEFGELAQLQNCTFAQSAAVQKRNGSVVLGNQDFSGNTLSAGQALGLYNKELLEIANGQLYSYSSTFSKMAAKGPLQPLVCTADPITQNTNNQLLADSATAGGVTCYFYQDQRNGITGGVRATFIDEATGVQILGDIQITATGWQPRVTALGGHLYLSYVQGTSLFVINYDPTTPQTIPAAAGLVADMINPGSGGSPYDVATNGTLLYFAYVNTTTNDMKVFSINAVLALISIIPNHFALGEAGSLWDIVLGFFQGFTKLTITYSLIGAASTQKIHFACYPANLSALVFGPNVITVPTAGAIMLNLATHEPDSTHFKIMWEDSETATGTDLTFTQTVNIIGSLIVDYTGAVTTAAAILLRSVGLASRAFAYNSINYYVITYNITGGLSTQPTFYIMTDLGAITGRFQGLTAGGFIFDSVSKLTNLPKLAQLSATKYAYPAIVTGQVQALNGKITSVTGVFKETINFAPVPAVTDIQLGLNTHFSGAMMSDYDGFGTMEHGFHVYPENMPAGSAQVATIETEISDGVLSTGGKFLTTTIDVPAESQWPLQSYMTLQGEVPGPVITSMVVVILRAGGVAPVFTAAPPFGLNVVVNLTPGANATTVAGQLATAITTTGGAAGMSATVGGVGNKVPNTWQLIIKAQQVQNFLAAPGFNSALTITIIQGAPNSSQQVIWDASFPDAAFITNGQYFVTCKNNAGTANYNYWFFHITGSPVVDPAPPSFSGQPLTAGFQINVNSTDLGDQVALQAAAGLAAHGYVVTTRSGNLISLVNGGAGGGPTYAFLPQNVNVGGTLEDGAYNYIAIYRKTDFAGQIHQSQPSLPLTVNVASPSSILNTVAGNTSFTAGSSGLVRIFVPMLRLTSSVPPRSKVTIEIYRTKHDVPGVYYRLTSTTNPILNDPTKDYVLYTDTTNDGTIQGNELAYTVGGVQPNIAVPAHSCVTVHKNRLVIVGCEDKKALYFSKPFVVGQGVGFGGPDPTQSRIRFDQGSQGGIVTALSMDNSLIVFFEDQIWLVSGDGPDPTGQNGGFSAPQLITSESGCNSASALCLGATGILYASDKGIYLLDRSLQVQYLGAPVDAYKAEPWTTMTLLPDRTEIRLGTAGTVNPSVLYDYYEKQWGTFTGQDTVDDLIWQGNYVYLQTNGQAVKEVQGSFQDNGVGISVLLETGWINIGSIAGFMNCRKGVIVGTWTLGTQIQIQVAYNYDETYETLVSQVASLGSFFGMGWFGQFSNYGGMTGTEAYEIRFDFSVQSISSIKLKITELSPGNNGFQINGIGLEVVRRGGVMRLAQNVAVSQ